jgi:MFS family permease
LAGDTAAPPQSGASSRATDRELAVVVGSLCLTQIVSWGVLYYAFPVLLTSISDDTGWSKTSLTATFSGALLIAGLAGIPAGRLLHQVGPRTVMTAGSVLATLSVLAVAAAPDRAVFTAAWAAIGVAMAGTLYAPAFAAVTIWFGARRVPALTKVTLVGGLASTTFAPLTAALTEHLGWRGSFAVLGVVLGLLTIPTHLVALRPAWPVSTAAHVRAAGDSHPVRQPPELLLLSACFAACALCSLAVLTNLVALLQQRGFALSDAALVLGVGGVGQVAGRLAYAGLHRRLGIRTRTVVVLVAVVLATAALALTPGPVGLLVVVALVAGNARGIFTLLQATAVSDRWGTDHYARLNGVFGAPLMIAGAVAPFVGSGLAAALGSYTAAVVLLAVAGLTGAVVTLTVRTPTAPGTAPFTGMSD